VHWLNLFAEFSATERTAEEIETDHLRPLTVEQIMHNIIHYLMT